MGIGQVIFAQYWRIGNKRKYAIRIQSNFSHQTYLGGKIHGDIFRHWQFKGN